MCYVRVNPIHITEYLFFAIFGQKNTDDFSISVRHKLQPKWTIYLFKISFSLYMLVTVIVLINLLIAMMSDTYQNIQSQSHIEWKYGLSKLIRKMQKTRTAPSPLNLFTTWITYLVKMCKKKASKKKKMSVMHGFMKNRTLSKSSFSQDNKILPLDRNKDNDNFALLRSSPFQSQSSLILASKIENVVEWDTVRRKYRMRFGDEIEKPSGEDDIVNGTI
ncbi:short transient receptor potential channel 7-like [Vespula pensylvanica]|uniref:short transient receptor potential channel 7-like n=1 Tax=Vespula pensylvanica TaxID=30213 RepID=UPI001CBA0803|nr:short transient receptor potential channel 7-like [Vespula pensylvanica]